MNGAVLSFLVYTGILTGIGIWSYKIVEKVPIAKYEQEFYAAGRGLGGIVVAFIIAGGLASAGTFIAGPGMAYAYGFTWIFNGIFYTFMNLMLLAPIGIVVGIVARRVNALTYLDVFKSRYESRAIVVTLAILVTIFLLPYMGTQFVGAARVITQMTGMNYILSLSLGSLVVLVYCVLGGMRGTSLAVLLQGLAMTAGCVLLFIGTIHSAGGLQNATESLAFQDINLLTPTGGRFTYAFTFSMACMLGFFIIGVPHAMLGALTFKNTKALKRGIWMGSVILVMWAIMLPMSGTIGRAINPNLAVPDEINPWLAMNALPPALGGIVLAGIVAGIQTTVAAMAIIITSSIARNVIREYKPNISDAASKKISRMTMSLCLLIAIALALFQPKLIQWIILFSVGGMEAITFGPILLGLFWKRGNKAGAMAAISWGTVIYALGNTVLPQINIGGMHSSFVPVVTSVIVYILVSLGTPPPSKHVMGVFWGRAKKAETR
ncbi:MAG: hypothetical protein JXB23_05590 [Candidatus Aminicenantes bacterium]|nr:hypothetical protein [Candidatus Aminicenantes bacterium]